MSKQTKSKTARSPLSLTNSLALRHRPLATAITLALSLSVNTVQAANIWVDTASDDVTGQCRLRDAIIAANTDATVEGCTAGSGEDFIRLLNIADSTITLEGTRLPTITTDVTIQGESVTIDAAGNSGLMDVSGGSLSINRLSLENGYANLVNDHAGGGIRVRNGASLTLHESTISNSTAKSDGGAISIEDGGENVVITGSTLSNNSALGTVTGTYGNGGGLFLAPVAGGVTLTLMNSTLSGNTASVTTGYGGGLYEYSNVSATINIVNSTLFGNTAGKSGGGIWGNANLLNSIIANSTAISNPDTAACMGGLTGNAESISLIQDKGTCSTSTGSFLDEDPHLGPLADNNGPTFTHAPIGTTNADSPVIDALNRQCFLQEKSPLDNVIFNFDLSSDQRGYERIDEQCDLGAVEVDGAALQTGPDFVITSNIDEYTDLNLNEELRRLTGDGHCNIAPGDCSVRDAVNAANVSADDSTITMAESLPRPIQIIMAGVEPLLVTSNLTIQGADASFFTGKYNRVRYVTRHITLDSARLTIHDLSLFNGWARSGSGGAILVRNEAALELVNSTLTRNEADVYGGAIDAGPGTEVTITGSTAELNLAGLQGGGIKLGAGAMLTLIDSTFTSNTINSICDSLDLTQRCAGGAISVQSGEVHLSNSTLSLNVAKGRRPSYGGGIYSVNSTITLENSTLSGNTTENVGGGLWVEDTDLTLTNSTLSGNSALAGGAILSTGNSSVKLFNSTLFANGDPNQLTAGGIGASGALELSNSIIANSFGLDCSGSPSITTQGVNLVGDGGVDCGFTPGPNLLSGDALLGPLANNGGPTLTHSPQAGSPVIDSGDNVSVPEGLLYDQRGIGYSRFINVDVDLGSVEWNGIIFVNSFEAPDP